MPELPISYYRHEEQLSETMRESRRRRRILEQLKEELHKSFEEEESQISLSRFVLHPVKTTKFTAKQWFVSGLQKEITGEMRYELVWKDVLGPKAGVVFKKDKLGKDVTVGEAVQEWLTTGRGSTIGGLGATDVDASAWNALRRQRQWDEMVSFKRSPAKFTWEKIFGKKLVEEQGVLRYKPAPLYKVTPKVWLQPKVQKFLVERGVAPTLAGARKAAREVTKKIAKPVVKATVKVVEKVAQVVASKLGASVGAAIGSAAPVVGTVAGWIAGEVIVKAGSKLIKPLWEITKICLLLLLGLFLGLFFWWVGTVMAAFRPPEVEALPGERFVEISKTANGANPLRLDLGADPSVLFTISYENVGESKLTSVTIEDDYAGDHDGDIILILDPGGGVNMGGKLIWNLSDLDPGAGSSVSYPTMIVDTSIEQVIINRAALTATNEDGETISVSTQGVVIVGEPEGQPPSGWPVAQGCITQGPYGSDTHSKLDAVDIAPVDPSNTTSADLEVFATHDGEASAYYGDPTYGNYVIIVSAEGFQSRYAHLMSIDPAVDVSGGADVVAGQLLGRMGSSGQSSGTHLHYDIRGGGYATSDYIPDSSFGACVGRLDCDCCFSSRNARCGE